VNFERNIAVELFIMGATHHTQAACADLSNDETVAGIWPIKRGNPVLRHAS
jgi:hypothetical protein